MEEQPLGEENGAETAPAEIAAVSDAFGLMGMEQPKAYEETKEEDIANTAHNQSLSVADGEG